jgi:pimeloyl-ACP methyl ester carboxylesterase
MGTLIELEGASLEVTLGRLSEAKGPLLCASHPAGALGADAVHLLEEASGAGALCVNPRGIGGSSAADERQPADTLAGMVDDIEAVRRRLGLPPWVFWGMSGGGWLGQVYARTFPDALAGLILESACPCFRLRLADPGCVLSPFHAPWRAALEPLGLVDPDSHAEAGDPGPTEWIDVDGVGSVFRRRGGPALLVSPLPLTPEMRRNMPLLWAHDARGWLATIRTPTLVLCGSADPVAPPAWSATLHEAIPGSELVIVEGAGHVPTGGRHPQAATAVRRFLRGRIEIGIASGRPDR